MKSEEIRHATQTDDYLNALNMYVTNGQPTTTAQVTEEIQAQWPFGNDISVTDGIVMEGRRITVPALLQQ